VDGAMEVLLVSMHPIVVLKDLAVYKGLNVYNFKFMLSHFLDKFHERNDIRGS
jgi:hypothetical protein